VRFPLNHLPESDSLLGNSRWIEEGRYDANEDQDSQEKMLGPSDNSSAHTSDLSEVNELDPTVTVSQNTRPDVLSINVAPNNDDTTL